MSEATDGLVPFAGPATATDGVTANGVSALADRLGNACGITADGSGNLLMAEASANEIRVVPTHTGTYYGRSMTTGHIYTIAGNGRPGFAGDTGPALIAELNDPEAVTTDHAGNVVISDSGNSRIRVVAVKSGTFYGQRMTAGDIYTVFALSGGIQPTAVDHSGNLVFVNGTNAYVYAEKSGTYYGQPMIAGSYYAIAQTDGYWPGNGLAIDGAGNVIITDQTSVQVVAASTGSFYGQSMTVGHVYSVAGGGTSSSDGIPALQARTDAVKVAVDGSGNLVLADQLAPGKVRVVAVKAGTFFGQAMVAGDIYTVAGTAGPSGEGGPATSAQLYGPKYAGVDAAGNVLFADYGSLVVRVLAQQTGVFFGQAMTKGEIYTIAGNGQVGRNSVTGGLALQESLNGPSGVAVDPSGNAIIADPGGDDTGLIKVLAEQTGQFYGQQMTAGHLYQLPGVGGTSVHLDHFHNVVTAIANSVDVLAVQTGNFYGIAMTAGQVYRVAGGGPVSSTAVNGIPATQAYLSQPTDTVVDSNGNLVIADAGFNMVRVVAYASGTFYGQSMKAGYIYDVAGDGTAGPGSNGIPAMQSHLNSPRDVTVDSAGNLVIADSRNNQIRVVATTTGTAYGQAMTAGDIYLLAGNGKYALGGDGGPATQASIQFPGAVAVVPGGILVADGTSRLRLITTG